VQAAVEAIKQSDVFKYMEYLMIRHDLTDRDRDRRDERAGRLVYDEGPDAWRPEPFEEDLDDELPEDELYAEEPAGRVRSPGGGSVVRGLYYPGGNYIPSKHL
jgi:hypothetical protein